jgi:hypothetical protein
MSVLLGVLHMFISSQKFKSTDAASAFVTTALSQAGVEGVVIWTVPIFLLALSIGGCVEPLFKRLSTTIVASPSVPCLSWFSATLFVQAIYLVAVAVQLMVSDSILFTENGYTYEPGIGWPMLAVLALSVCWGYRSVVTMQNATTAKWRPRMRRVLGGVAGLFATLAFALGTTEITSRTWALRTSIAEHLPSIAATTCVAGTDTSCLLVLHGGSRRMLMLSSTFALKLYRNKGANADSIPEEIGTVTGGVRLMVKPDRGPVALPTDGDLALEAVIETKPLCELYFNGMSQQERKNHQGFNPMFALAYMAHTPGLTENGTRFREGQTGVVHLSDGEGNLQFHCPADEQMNSPAPPLRPDLS